jgi:hypothetical protein
MPWILVLIVLALGSLVGYFAYSRSAWSALRADFAIANQAMKRVEQLSRDWGERRTNDERHRCLENARRELGAAQRNHAQKAEYKLVRAYLDDALWWLATLLIAQEPEYLQDLFGEHREMIKHLFWSWNGSMAWDGVKANREQLVVRKVRLDLYREIKALSAAAVLPENVLDAARLCLAKRDFPGSTPTSRLDAERVFVSGALRALRAHRDDALLANGANRKLK